MVVQQYIDNPLTLNDTKFHIQLYVLVTSINPLRIYLLDDGHVLMAAVKYDQKDFKNVYKHLTNVHLNRNHKDFKQTSWNMKDLWFYIDAIGFDSKAVKVELKDAIVKTLIMAEEDLYECNKNNSFEFFQVIQIKVNNS